MRPDATFTVWGVAFLSAAGLAAVVVLTRGNRTADVERKLTAPTH